MPENLDLNQRLQQKLDQERQIIQQLTQRNYDKLRKELAAITNTATNTIKKDMERQNLVMSLMLGKFWLAPALVGLSLCLGIFIGSWGLTRYLTSRLTEKQQSLDYLNQKINSQIQELRQQQETLENLNQKTGGITIYQTENGTFLTLPSNSTLKEGWQCQEKPCLKLEP